MGAKCGEKYMFRTEISKVMKKWAFGTEISEDTEK